MSIAKFGILSVVLGTPFGLAVYKDFVADPPPRQRAYADDFGDLGEVDLGDDGDTDLDDYADYADYAGNADDDDEPSLEERLVESLGYAPTIPSGADFDAFTTIASVKSGEVLSDGSPAGTFITLADDIDLRHELVDVWDAPDSYADAQGITRHFWFNENDGVRAMLEAGLGQQRLALRPYTPLSMLVDEAMASVGEPVENLLVPDTTANPIELSRPPTEFSDGPTRLLVRHARGKVTGYQIEADLVYAPDAEMRLISSLGHHGEIVPTDLASGKVYAFVAEVGQPLLRVRPEGNRLVILVDPPAQPSK